MAGFRKNYIECMFSKISVVDFFVALIVMKLWDVQHFSEELFTTNVWGISWVNVNEDYRHNGLGEN